MGYFRRIGSMLKKLDDQSILIELNQETRSFGYQFFDVRSSLKLDHQFELFIESFFIVICYTDDLGRSVDSDSESGEPWNVFVKTGINEPEMIGPGQSGSKFRIRTQKFSTGPGLTKISTTFGRSGDPYQDPVELWRYEKGLILVNRYRQVLLFACLLWFRNGHL